MKFGIVNEEEYRKNCSRLYILKLCGAFVVGMTVMLLGMSLFDYMYRQQNFTFFPPVTGNLGNTLGENVAGDTASTDNAAADITVDVDTAEETTSKHVKDVSYQVQARAYMGIDVMNVSGSNQTQKVIITGVVSGSPAETAGLTRGDGIISLEWRKIGSIAVLTQLMSGMQPDDRVRIEIDRDGRRMFMYVKLGSETVDSLPAGSDSIVRISSDEMSQLKAQSRIAGLGIAISALPYSIGEDEKGVVVETVVTGSAADTAGLKAGDLITAVNREQTPDLVSFFDVFPGRGAAILDVSRQDDAVYIIIAAEEDKPVCKRVTEDE